MRCRILSPRGANSALGPRTLRETVATGTGSPRDASSRTAAACGRKRSQTCTGNHAWTETPGGERSTGRGGGSAIAVRTVALALQFPAVRLDPNPDRLARLGTVRLAGLAALRAGAFLFRRLRAPGLHRQVRAINPRRRRRAGLPSAAALVVPGLPTGPGPRKRMRVRIRIRRAGLRRRARPERLALAPEPVPPEFPELPLQLADPGHRRSQLPAQLRALRAGRRRRRARLSACRHEERRPFREPGARPFPEQE